jgi:hypothetical protein
MGGEPVYQISPVRTFGAGCAAPIQLIWYNPNVDNQTAQIHLMQ